MTNYCHVRNSVVALLLGTYFFLVVTLPTLRLNIGPIPIYVVDVLVVCLVGYIVIYDDAILRVPDSRLLGLFVLFVGASFVALSQGMSLTGFSIYNLYTMGRLLLAVVAPIAVITLAGDRFHLAAAVGGLTFGMVFIGVIGILHIVPSTEPYVLPALRAYYPAESFALYRLTYHTYAFATWYTATTYAAVLSMTMMFPIVSWLRLMSPGYLLAAAVGLVAFVLAETRHPVLALLPVLLVVGWLNVTRRQRVLLGGGVLILLVVLQLVGVGRTPISFATDFAGLLGPISEQEGVQIRLRSIQNFFAFAEAHPIRTAIGFGPDFIAVVGRSGGDDLILAAADAKAINSVLTLVLYYGLVGMLAYFAIVGRAIGIGFNRFGLLDYSTVTELSFVQSTAYAGTVALIVGLLLHPFDQYFVFGGIKTRHVFWGILAIQQAALQLDQDSG